MRRKVLATNGKRPPFEVVSRFDDFAKRILSLSLYFKTVLNLTKLALFR